MYCVAETAAACAARCVHAPYLVLLCTCVCVCVRLVSSFHERAVQPAAVVACSLNICGVNTNSTKAPFPQGKHWKIQCVNASALIIHLCRK